MDSIGIFIFFSLVVQGCTVSLREIAASLNSVEDMLNKLLEKEAKSETLDTHELKAKLKDYIDDQINRNTGRKSNTEVILRGLMVEKKLRRQMNERIGSLEETLVEKVKQIETLEDKVSALEKTVTTKSTDITELKTSDDQMKQVVFEFMEDITWKIDVFQTAFDKSINVVNETLAAAIDKSNRDIDDIKSISLSLPTKRSRTIAFSARIRYGKSYKNVDPWQTLVFSDVLLNIGNGYSGATGEFVVPVKGVYVFHVHITGGDNKGLEICLRKNKSNMLFLYVKGPSHGTDSGSISLGLSEGDVVKVIKYGPWGDKPFYVRHVFSSFSGFLLFEE